MPPRPTARRARGRLWPPPGRRGGRRGGTSPCGARPRPPGAGALRARPRARLNRSTKALALCAFQTPSARPPNGSGAFAPTPAAAASLVSNTSLHRPTHPTRDWQPWCVNPRPSQLRPGGCLARHRQTRGKNGWAFCHRPLARQRSYLVGLHRSSKNVSQNAACPSPFGDFVSLVLHYVATSPKFGERRPNVHLLGCRGSVGGAQEDAGPDGGAHPSQALPRSRSLAADPRRLQRQCGQALQGFGRSVATGR